MKFFDCLGWGWELGIKSFEVIGVYFKLLFFLVFLGLVLIVVVFFFGGVFFGLVGFDF